MQIALISIFGVVGVLLRYFFGILIIRGFGRSLSNGFPYSTVLINLAGCFLIGIVYTLSLERTAISEPIRIALMVGLLGGFTTFSSFSIETYLMLSSGRWGLALLNVSVSVFGGLVATVAGIYIGRYI
jgi:fluoride exporter